jgi:hypothetical protein
MSTSPNNKINAVSQEFPLSTSFSNKIQKKQRDISGGLKFFPDLKSGYSNDLPDCFRLDAMHERKNSYINPFLNDVEKQDRSYYLKEANKIRDSIAVLDKLKSSKKISQNPNFIRKVVNSFDVNMINKRNKNDMGKFQINENPKIFYTLQKENNVNSYTDKIKKLHFEYSPKQPFNIKNSIEFDKSQEINDFNVPISLKIDPKNSSYLKNYNDYNIRENYEFNNDKYFTFKRKEVEHFSPIIGQNPTKVVPEKYVSPKWSAFYEKYIYNLNLVIFYWQIEIKDFREKVDYSQNMSTKILLTSI